MVPGQGDTIEAASLCDYRQGRSNSAWSVGHRHGRFVEIKVVVVEDIKSFRTLSFQSFTMQSGIRAVLPSVFAESEAGEEEAGTNRGYSVINCRFGGEAARVNGARICGFLYLPFNFESSAR